METNNYPMIDLPKTGRRMKDVYKRQEEYREYFMFEKTVKFLVDNAVISEQ